jgi:hypothetical protein
MFELHDFTIWMKRIAIFKKLRTYAAAQLITNSTFYFRHQIG